MNKKILCVAGALMMAACADLAQYSTTDANASAQTKMKACLISDANTRLQAGTLFTNGIKETAKDMVSSCMKKLALQSAGISEESQATAQSIISSLQNMRSTN